MTDDLDQARREAEQWRLGQTSAAYESGPAGAGGISPGKGDHVGSLTRRSRSNTWPIQMPP